MTSSTVAKELNLQVTVNCPKPSRQLEWKSVSPDTPYANSRQLPINKPPHLLHTWVAQMSTLGNIPDLGPPTHRSEHDYTSSASSGRKRRRDESPQQSSSFLSAAKNLVAQKSNADICWNCDAPSHEYCHVVARADPSVSCPSSRSGQRGMADETSTTPRPRRACSRSKAWAITEMLSSCAAAATNTLIEPRRLDGCSCQHTCTGFWTGKREILKTDRRHLPKAGGY